MGPWKLACVVQVVNFRRRNGATPTVSPHDMNKRTGETIPEFLERLVELMLQQPCDGLAKHLIFDLCPKDKGQMTPSSSCATCPLLPAYHLKSAVEWHRTPWNGTQNLAFGVTYWRWLNELMVDLAPAWSWRSHERSPVASMHLPSTSKKGTHSVRL
jgi:hypothetical protein